VYDHLTTEHTIGEARPFQFIDCGCGVGNILLLARETAGYRTTGLEYEPEMVKIAKLLTPDSTILHQDILTYEDYKLYDVIYYHCPLSDKDKTNRFLDKICKDMKVGAVIVDPLENQKHVPRMEKDERFKNIFTRFIKMPHELKDMAWEKVKE